MPEEPAELTGADPLGLMANVGNPDDLVSPAAAITERGATTYTVFHVNHDGDIWTILNDVVARSGRDAVRTWVEAHGLESGVQEGQAGDYRAIPIRNITAVTVKVEERTVRDVTFT